MNALAIEARIFRLKNCTARVNQCRAHSEQSRVCKTASRRPPGPRLSQRPAVIPRSEIGTATGAPAIIPSSLDAPSRRMKKARRSDGLFSC